VKNPFAFLFEYPDEQALANRGDVVSFTSDEKGAAHMTRLPLAHPPSARPGV